MSEPPLDRPAGVADHYRSVDSSPARYARSEPPGRVNGFMLAFAATSVLVQLVFTALVQSGFAPPGRDLVFFSNGGQRAQIPARLFLVTFFAVFAFWIDTNVWRRLLVAVELVIGTMLAALVIDLLAAILGSLLDLDVQVQTQQVLTALLGMLLFPLVLARNAVLPPAGPNPPRPARGITWVQWCCLVGPLLIAFALGAWVEIRWTALIDWMRSWALLGGVGPGLFLVQQAFTMLTALIGLVIVRRSRRKHRAFAPDIAVLVPAHNEAHGIAATIDAVAEAARGYRGGVHLYVVDNASTDTTVVVARSTIAAADGLSGEVLVCDEPGKAIALNYGLARIREEFVVRIDADTVIGAACLDIALQHLADPKVGAVGGVPLPSSERSFFDRVRRVEVLIRHGFFQVSLLGFGGILGVPGMFTVYRKAALDQVGDLVQGMNGEDTDICLRISAAGYRVVVDPSAVYYSETPQSWAHMREQRLRWFRSIYHVSWPQSTPDVRRPVDGRGGDPPLPADQRGPAFDVRPDARRGPDRTAVVPGYVPGSALGADPGDHPRAAAPVGGLRVRRLARVAHAPVHPGVPAVPGGPQLLHAGSGPLAGLPAARAADAPAPHRRVVS